MSHFYVFDVFFLFFERFYICGPKYLALKVAAANLNQTQPAVGVISDDRLRALADHEARKTTHVTVVMTTAKKDEYATIVSPTKTGNTKRFEHNEGTLTRDFYRRTFAETRYVQVATSTMSCTVSDVLPRVYCTCLLVTSNRQQVPVRFGYVSEHLRTTIRRQELSRNARLI